jgi:hypothetical protein
LTFKQLFVVGAIFMKTIKSFIEQSHINAALIRAVVRQVGGWDSFKELAIDVTNHGASGGFSGFIYYVDTLTFYRRNKAAVNEALSAMADDLGAGVLEMVRGFNCLGEDFSTDEIGKAVYGSFSNQYDTQIYNALAWFALEEVARSYSDLINNYVVSKQS